MKWFYEIVIALLFFSLLLFCTEIIRSDYDIETEILSIFTGSLNTLLCYSTVTECFGNGVLSKNSTLLCFDLNLSSQNLWTPKYSDYQVFLYQTITDFREKGMNDVQIANWLNDNGYQTVRGSTFKNNHVHFIAKKRRRRLDIPDTEPSLSISNMKVRYK